MNSSIIIKVKSLYPDLTKSEKRVAIYVNNHLHKISYLSIGDLASQCGVGETTILRFCKRLGFSGYYEFKQQAILELEKNTTDTYLEQFSTIQRIKTMLDETIELIDYEYIDRASHYILESESIYLFGSGFSGLTSQAAQMRFASFGYKVVAANDKYLKTLYAYMITHKDVAIGISISGENISTIESIKIAKENGAKIIIITNHEESTLAKLGDIVLLTSGKEMGREGSTLVTEMSQYIILEVLFEKLHELDKEKIEEMNYKVSVHIRGE